MDWDRAEKAEQLLQILEAWIDKHDVTTSEAIYQVDSINLSLPELVEEMCESIDYGNESED